MTYRIIGQIVPTLACVVVYVASQTNDNLNATNPDNNPASQTADNNGSLKVADVAAIVLGVILLCVVIATVVICVLFKKGYLGDQEQSKVLPSVPEIYTTAESLREFSSAAMDKTQGSRERYDTGIAEPIIFLRDDIYHPPNSRPTAENLAELQRRRSADTKPPKMQQTTGRSSRRKRKSSKMSRTVPNYRKSSLVGTQPYPDESIFISDKGGMKFTMFYETQSPYGDRNHMSKTF